MDWDSGVVATPAVEAASAAGEAGRMAEAGRR